jgi:hypothetical protein
MVRAEPGIDDELVALLKARNVFACSALSIQEPLVNSQVPGFTEHRELEAIARAGVPPLEAIRAATESGAGVLGLNDRGTLTAGKRADFLVLTANPLDDIANSRRIAAVYKAGVAIDRDALKKAFFAQQGRWLVQVPRSAPTDGRVVSTPCYPTTVVVHPPMAVPTIRHSSSDPS